MGSNLNWSWVLSYNNSVSIGLKIVSESIWIFSLLTSVVNNGLFNFSKMVDYIRPARNGGLNIFDFLVGLYLIQEIQSLYLIEKVVLLLLISLLVEYV